MKIKLLTSIAGRHDDGDFSYGFGQEVDASAIGFDYANNLCSSGQAEEIAPATAVKPKAKTTAKPKVDVNATPDN